MAKDYSVSVKVEVNGEIKKVKVYTSEVKELMRRASYKNASNYLSMIKTFIEEYDEEEFEYSAEFYNFVDDNDFDYLASCVLLGTPVIMEDGWSVEDVYKVMTSKDRSLKAALKYAMTYADMDAYSEYCEEQ